MVIIDHTVYSNDTIFYIGMEYSLGISNSNGCEKASMKYPMISQKIRFVLWHGCHVRRVIQQLIG